MSYPGYTFAPSSSSFSFQPAAETERPATSDSSPISRSAKRKGARSVKNLSEAQLQRKRANDREAQRCIRQRTKDHIAGLEGQIEKLKTHHGCDPLEVENLKARNKALEEEVRRLRSQLGASRPFQPYLGAVFDGNSSMPRTLPSSYIDTSHPQPPTLRSHSGQPLMINTDMSNQWQSLSSEDGGSLPQSAADEYCFSAPASNPTPGSLPPNMTSTSSYYRPATATMSNGSAGGHQRFTSPRNSAHTGLVMPSSAYTPRTSAWPQTQTQSLGQQSQIPRGMPGNVSYATPNF